MFALATDGNLDNLCIVCIFHGRLFILLFSFYNKILYIQLIDLLHNTDNIEMTKYSLGHFLGRVVSDDDLMRDFVVVEDVNELYDGSWIAYNDSKTDFKLCLVLSINNDKRVKMNTASDSVVLDLREALMYDPFVGTYIDLPKH